MTKQRIKKIGSRFNFWARVPKSVLEFQFLARASKCEKWGWSYYRGGFEKNEGPRNFESGS